MQQLTPDDLYNLTGWKRSSDQARWLADQGIPHRLVDKRVIVLAKHVEAWLLGKPQVISAGPNWAAVN